LEKKDNFILNNIFFFSFDALLQFCDLAYLQPSQIRMYSIW
jgi:hypothetical protein